MCGQCWHSGDEPTRAGYAATLSGSGGGARDVDARSVQRSLCGQCWHSSDEPTRAGYAATLSGSGGGARDVDARSVQRSLCGQCWHSGDEPTRAGGAATVGGSTRDIDAWSVQRLSLEVARLKVVVAELQRGEQPQPGPLHSPRLGGRALTARACGMGEERVVSRAPRYTRTAPVVTVPRPTTGGAPRLRPTLAELKRAGAGVGGRCLRFLSHDGCARPQCSFKHEGLPPEARGGLKSVVLLALAAEGGPTWGPRLLVEDRLERVTELRRHATAGASKRHARRIDQPPQGPRAMEVSGWGKGLGDCSGDGSRGISTAVRSGPGAGARDDDAPLVEPGRGYLTRDATGAAALGGPGVGTRGNGAPPVEPGRDNATRDALAESTGAGGAAAGGSGVGSRVAGTGARGGGAPLVEPCHGNAPRDAVAEPTGAGDEAGGGRSVGSRSAGAAVLGRLCTDARGGGGPRVGPGRGKLTCDAFAEPTGVGGEASGGSDESSRSTGAAFGGRGMGFRGDGALQVEPGRGNTTCDALAEPTGAGDEAGGGIGVGSRGADAAVLGGPGAGVRGGGAPLAEPGHGKVTRDASGELTGACGEASGGRSGVGPRGVCAAARTGHSTNAWGDCAPLFEPGRGNVISSSLRGRLRRGSRWSTGASRERGRKLASLARYERRI